MACFRRWVLLDCPTLLCDSRKPWDAVGHFEWSSPSNEDVCSLISTSRCLSARRWFVFLFLDYRIKYNIILSYAAYVSSLKVHRSHSSSIYWFSFKFSFGEVFPCRFLIRPYISGIHVGYFVMLSCWKCTIIYRRDLYNSWINICCKSFFLSWARRRSCSSCGFVDSRWRSSKQWKRRLEPCQGGVATAGLLQFTTWVPSCQDRDDYRQTQTFCKRRIFNARCFALVTIHRVFEVWSRVIKGRRYPKQTWFRIMLVLKERYNHILQVIFQRR